MLRDTFSCYLEDCGARVGVDVSSDLFLHFVRNVINYLITGSADRRIRHVFLNLAMILVLEGVHVASLLILSEREGFTNLEGKLEEQRVNANPCLLQVPERHTIPTIRPFLSVIVCSHPIEVHEETGFVDLAFVVVGLLGLVHRPQLLIWILCHFETALGKLLQEEPDVRASKLKSLPTC